MLRELENYSAILQNPWMLAPAILLVVVVSCLQLLLYPGKFLCRCVPLSCFC